MLVITLAFPKYTVYFLWPSIFTIYLVYTVFILKHCKPFQHALFYC